MFKGIKMSKLDDAIFGSQRKNNVKYSQLTSNGNNPYFIHNKTGKKYYVRDVKLDCTNSRGGHEAERYLVEYGAVWDNMSDDDLPTPYVRDLDEFVTGFTPAPNQE